MLLIKRATMEDMEWVNSQYKKVEFLLSELNNEIIAIAYINEEKVGLGRLVKIDDKNYEMGGIVTLGNFRGMNVASKVVEFLVSETRGRKVENTYCIPFEHLRNFYNRYGFKEVEDFTNVPEKIFHKYNWCKEQYDKDTLLMKL